MEGRGSISRDAASTLSSDAFGNRAIGRSDVPERPVRMSVRWQANASVRVFACIYVHIHADTQNISMHACMFVYAHRLLPSERRSSQVRRLDGPRHEELMDLEVCVCVCLSQCVLKYV